MNKPLASLVTVIFISCVCSVHGDYSVADTGQWPDTWPKELDPLRKQSRTLVGPLIEYQHFLIPFTKRDEFEAAWPHLLKAKTKGAPIILVRPSEKAFFNVKPAGVHMISPPANIDRKANPEKPLDGDMDLWTKWHNTTYMELVVDGDIVDLNRIPLPADTPIVDQRFKEEKKK